jgi:restriction system protein
VSTSTTVILIAAAVTLIIAAIRHYRNEMDKLRSSSHLFFNTHEEMRKTMAMGLYYRFQAANWEKKSDGTMGLREVSSLFTLQRPTDFEYFVAEVFKNFYGGDVWVTKAAGDFGIDFEHRREDGLYLIQVKCYEQDLAFDPIAIVHSQMKKQRAKGGFVVTTGSYSDNARWYAQGVGVELIDGVQLADMWAEGLEKKKELLKAELAT